MALISIIMPCYNAAKFIQRSIESVLQQSYSDWELLIINDGSTDATHLVVTAFHDNRIRYFEQHNKGVSVARNVGLHEMRGDYFCFLDADDALPLKSIEARLHKFETDSTVEFVDGMVEIYDVTLTTKVKTYTPDFRGNPLVALITLNSKCFFGITWMVKRHAMEYKMKEGLSHGEDLLFYMQLARNQGLYDYVDAPILYNRQHSTSAMQNFEGLLQGYKTIYREISTWPEIALGYRMFYLFKTKKILFLSYVSRREIRKAFASLLK